MNLAIDIERYYRELENVPLFRTIGKVTRITGLLVESEGPETSIGSICTIYSKNGKMSIEAETLGFRGNKLLLMPLNDIRGIGPGCKVIVKEQNATMSVGKQLLGRVIDGVGNPIDGKGPIKSIEKYPIYAEPINPILRPRIKNAVETGVRAIDGLLTVGCGQRIGIFAGSGVGKSVLLGMIARHSNADINVIGLIGERGREVNEFIENELGTSGLKKSVVVAATSDNPPLIRLRGAYIATTIAEYFRDLGYHVNLLMDSVTRFATSQREVGLALGEPPTAKGYTPSVFALLPKILERAGTSINRGEITGYYTILVEGDDMNDPIADSVRSIIDGHIVLTRELANQNQYPAIDVLKSISRVMNNIIDKDHLNNANKFKSILATYQKAEDLVNIGAYITGSNKKIDEAIQLIEKIREFLKQDANSVVKFENSISELKNIVSNN
jgi:flagellum-specific ATP synthase